MIRKTKGRVGGGRGRARVKKRPAKYIIAKDAEINYKDISLLQKYLTDRGKFLARRITGVNAKQQRALNISVKRARYLGLLPVGGVKKN